MGEFASKGVAGTGLGFGIAGTALGLLNNNNGYGNSLLGGLLGNNCNGVYANQTSALMAENAMLKAENYSDKVGKEVYERLSERFIDKYISPMAQEIADMRVREARTEGKINEVACLANNGIKALQGQVASLYNTMNGITKVVIPRDIICPEVMERYNSWVAPANTTSDEAA